MPRPFKALCFILPALAMGFVACDEEAPEKPEEPEISGSATPEWVAKGSRAATTDDGRVFLGVGLSRGIRNLGLARTTADNRARAEIAKLIDSYTTTLVERYPAAAGDGEVVVTTRKTMSAVTLSGVQIVDHWMHPENGSVFALARLELDAVASAVDKTDLDDALKAFMAQEAQKAHAELEEGDDAGGGAAADTPAAPQP